MNDVGRVALAARVFTIAALTSIAALAGEEYLKGALLVVAIAAVAIALSLTRRLPEWVVAVLEGSTVAVVAALTYPDQATVTPYLVKQPVNAFGAETLPDLTRSFVDTGFDLRKLMVEIVTTSAPTGGETLNPRAAHQDTLPPNVFTEK